jgi:hypothetical protein
MPAAADAASFRRLCDVHLNCVGGEATMVLHASRIHSVMAPVVHVCGCSSGVTAQKVVGPGPLPSWLQYLVRPAVNASMRSASSGTAIIGSCRSGLSAAALRSSPFAFRTNYSMLPPVRSTAMSSARQK